MNKNISMIMFCFALLSSCKNNSEQTQTKKEIDSTVSSTELFPSPKVPIKTIGIYLYEGYSTLDALGPYSIFTQLMGSKVFFIAKHKGIIYNGGLKIQVDTTIDEVKHLDILVIPGGLAQTYQEAKDTALLNWVRSIDSTSTYTTSVCTGAWILGATGLLKDKEATTHWYGKKILADVFGAKVQNTRYTHSGKYWTSAGVSAGIDMSLALLNEIAGEQYTKAAMLGLEYDPQPPFKGGSENNTDKNIVEAMRTMYDNGMKPALHPELAFKDLTFDSPKDLVCGMPVKAGVADTVHYKGKVYGFCSSECKKEFSKNPTTYLTTK